MEKTLKAILAGGLIAGTLDIIAGVLIYHVAPIAILQAVASGILGKASYSGGLATAILGMVLQWAMSLIITAIYAFAAKRFPILIRQWLPMGLAYGVGIWVVMNLIVVPLSAAFPKNPPKLDVGVLIMLAFGVIVSYCVKRFEEAGTETLEKALPPLSERI